MNPNNINEFDIMLNFLLPSIKFEDIRTSLSPMANNNSIRPTNNPNGNDKRRTVLILFPIRDVKLFMFKLK